MKLEIEHENLINMVLTLDGMAIICGYPSDLYTDRLESKGWIRKEKTARDNKKRERTEAIWLNPLVQEKLAEKKSRLF